MSKILKLPADVTNKIAAGEVIERPSSVVKELIENSIDASSTKIEIHINNGGKDKILILDDGKGMSRDDAVLSLERFTTSKIEKFEDLDQLGTLGFRGEALASIASVSLIEIKTKNGKEEEGTLLKADGGNVVTVKGTSWNKGTSISVNNLFYNTPARKKFQKNTLSEVRQVYRVFKHCALAYPELHLSLYKDGSTVWNLNPSDLITRIKALFSSVVKEDLVEIDYADPLHRLTGFISTPEYTRSTRTEQYLFLNGRHIKNRTADHGVYQGYGSTLSHGNGHPFYVLKLEMNPETFDVNIHPTKLEARFRDEKAMHHCFSQAVKKALGTPGIDFSRPVVSVSQKEEEERAFLSMATDLFTERKPTGQLTEYDAVVPTDAEVMHHIPEKQPVSIERKSPGVEKDKVWQVHQCYIFAQVKSGLIIIDQHTAHERVLYEKTLKMFERNEKPSQQLLFPQTVELDKEYIVVLNQISPYLQKLGFELKIFGNDTAVIDAVPLEVKIGREVQVLKDVLKQYMSDEFKDIDIHDRIARMFACRSAIMKGDKLKTDEMYKLIDDLFATEFPFYCPHGRPTVVDMNIKELNAKFLR